MGKGTDGRHCVVAERDGRISAVGGEKEGHLKMILKTTDEEGVAKFLNCIGFGLGAYAPVRCRGVRGCGV